MRGWIVGCPMLWFMHAQNSAGSLDRSVMTVRGTSERGITRTAPRLATAYRAFET